MTKSDFSNATNKAKVHTKLSMMLSLLKAFKLAELLTIANNMLALFAIVYAPTVFLKALATLVIVMGLLVFYLAIRIRIDVILFEYWDTLDLLVLDEALANIKPKHQSGRTLEARLQGSYQLFNRGLLLLGAQFCILLLAVWML